MSLRRELAALRVLRREGLRGQFDWIAEQSPGHGSSVVTADSSTLEYLLRRDRYIVAGGLAAVTAASWIYVLTGAGMDQQMHSSMSTMSTSMPWTPGHFGLMFVMWWVMMIAMMVPSAAPTVLIYARLNNPRAQNRSGAVPAWIFASGYLVAWGGFSLLATAAQWGLDKWFLISPMMQVTSVHLGAALFIAAGVYQLTPLKHACLRHCRSPLHFVASRWRPGAGPAFRMGLEHGLFCLGCCWVLMALLFYGGVMSPWWIGGLALYVMIEKLAPLGHQLGRYNGGLLLGWGGWLLIDAIA